MSATRAWTSASPGASSASIRPKRRASSHRAGRSQSPPELAEYVFNYYAWTEPAGAPVRQQLSIRNDTPAQADGILFFTHADTDLLTLRAALAELPDGFPPVRALSLGKVATEEHLAAALAWPGTAPRIVVTRLLGGIYSVPGLANLRATARPIPLPPPVTTASLPLSRKESGFPFRKNSLPTQVFKSTWPVPRVRARASPAHFSHRCR